MSDTIADIDPATLDAMLGEFICADAYHTAGQSSHNPDQPGEFVLLNPCCGDRTILCRSRAYYLKYMAATIHCTSCDKTWSPSVYRFVPVRPGVKPL